MKWLLKVAYFEDTFRNLRPSICGRSCFNILGDIIWQINSLKKAQDMEEEVG